MSTSKKEREEAAGKLRFEFKYVGFRMCPEHIELVRRLGKKRLTGDVFDKGHFLTRLKRKP